MIIRTAIYIRVSTDQQAREGDPSLRRSAWTVISSMRLFFYENFKTFFIFLLTIGDE